MARRVLITGIAGQDGSYLAELLLARGDEVTGLDRPGAFDSPNLDAVRGELHRGRRRPARPRVAEGVDRDRASRRDLPPRRADVRPRLVGRPDADDGGDRRRRPAPCSRQRSPPIRSPRVWVTSSSEIFGDAPAEPAGRGHADAPAHPVRRREARRPRPRADDARSTTACSRAAASPTTTSRRAGRTHFLPRKVTRGAAAIALGRRASSCSATSTPPATGRTRATSSAGRRSR